jgi:hypothetical protein
LAGAKTIKYKNKVSLVRKLGDLSAPFRAYWLRAAELRVRPIRALPTPGFDAEGENIVCFPHRNRRLG